MITDKSVTTPVALLETYGFKWIATPLQATARNDTVFNILKLFDYNASIYFFRQPESIIEALSKNIFVKLTISVSDFIADGIVYCEPCKVRRGNLIDIAPIAHCFKDVL